MYTTFYLRRYDDEPPLLLDTLLLDMPLLLDTLLLLEKLLLPYDDAGLDAGWLLSNEEPELLLLNDDLGLVVLYDELPVYPCGLPYEAVPVFLLYDDAGLLKFVWPDTAAVLLLTADMLRFPDTAPLYDWTERLTPDVTLPDAVPAVPVEGLVAGRVATIPERLAVTLLLVE